VAVLAVATRAIPHLRIQKWNQIAHQSRLQRFTPPQPHITPHEIPGRPGSPGQLGLVQQLGDVFRNGGYVGRSLEEGKRKRGGRKDRKKAMIVWCGGEEVCESGACHV